MGLFWAKWKMYILLGLSSLLTVLYMVYTIRSGKKLESNPMTKVLIEQEKKVTDHIAETYKKANAGDEAKIKEIDQKIKELEDERETREIPKTPSEISQAFRDLGY